MPRVETAGILAIRGGIALHGSEKKPRTALRRWTEPGQGRCPGRKLAGDGGQTSNGVCTCQKRGWTGSSELGGQADPGAGGSTIGTRWIGADARLWERGVGATISRLAGRGEVWNSTAIRHFLRGRDSVGPSARQRVRSSTQPPQVANSFLSLRQKKLTTSNQDITRKEPGGGLRLDSWVLVVGLGDQRQGCGTVDLRQETGIVRELTRSGS
jgi:hypothetical protein